MDPVANNRFASGEEYVQCGCVQSKGFCHYKCTNGIKRHLAVDTLGLPFFTHCTLFECIRRSRLNWTVEPQSELLSRLTRQYPENYHSAWQRVSPGQAHSRIAKTLPTNYDQGQVWTRTIANQSRENSPRSIWICPGGNPMGHWALECLDGTLSRVWSKILRKLWTMLLQNSIFASSDWCSKG